MTKLHISPATGRVNICRATSQACPTGGDQFDSKKAAHAAYENKNKALSAASIKKTRKKSSTEIEIE